MRFRKVALTGVVSLVVVLAVAGLSWKKSASHLASGPTQNKQEAANPVCSESPITAKEFIERIHSVVVHGDLTDMPFLERTLNVKFLGEVKGGRHWAIHHHTDSIVRYRIDSAWNLPITMKLTFYKDNAGDAALINFIMYWPVDYIDHPARNCLKVLARELDNAFGGSFNAYPPAYCDETRRNSKITTDGLCSKNKCLGQGGKNNTYISIGYGYHYANQLIHSFGIDQGPPGVCVPVGPPF
jgi:hypothetical protein